MNAFRIRFKFNLETGNLKGLIFRIALINLSVDGLLDEGTAAPEAEG